MGPTSPDSLPAAGQYLLAAGFIAAFTGGLYGLHAFRPGIVVLSVLLVTGYSVAGYLLLSRRDVAFRVAAALAGVLALATLWLFQAGVTTLFGAAFTHLVLFPALAATMALAGAHLAAYAIARANPRVLWPRRGTPGVAGLLQAAGVAVVACAFVLAYVDTSRAAGSPDANLATAGGILAGAACAAGGILASVKRHPRFALAGGVTGFVASAAFLFAFAAVGATAYLGQVIALVGLLLVAFPIAISIIAWVELEAARRARAEDPGTAPHGGGATK